MSETPTLKLFNTLTGTLDEFKPLTPGKVRMYVCGPTVYDDAHLGHARCYITWDVLYRFLKFLGYDVTYVRNVTDVDDKILNRAREQNTTPQAVAEKNYESFKADMAALNVLPPDIEPRATEHIAGMIEGIQALIAKGAAYVSADGSVYYRVSTKPDYGKLKYHTTDPVELKKHLDDLKAGARVDVDEEKESPLDFALWKGVPLDDPNGWESPWPAQGQTKGWGRPGWHMECSAMNHAVFGEQIDIHAGGADLIFPHHENEIAQSESWTGKTPFAQYWMHNGFVNVSGEKMSKSLGNFSSIKKILERYDANTIRHFLLTNKYRMPVDFNDEALEGSRRWTVRIYRDIRQSCEQLGLGLSELETLVVQQYNSTSNRIHILTLQPFVDAMNNDLNTPQALAILNKELVAVLDDLDGLAEIIRVHGTDRPAREHFVAVMSVFYHLGFEFQGIFQQKKADLPKDEIHTIHKELTGQWMEPDREPEVLLEEILQYRKKAKEIKNWTQADAIRKHLSDIGIQIMDNKDGTTTWELSKK